MNNQGRYYMYSVRMKKSSMTHGVSWNAKQIRGSHDSIEDEGKNG